MEIENTQDGGIRVTQKPWTDWCVEVYPASEDKPVNLSMLEPIFRTTSRQLFEDSKHQEVELFTLMPRDSDAIAIQVALHPKGGVRVECHVPALVRVSHPDKRVSIGLFDVAEWARPSLDSYLGRKTPRAKK